MNWKIEMKKPLTSSKYTELKKIKYEKKLKEKKYKFHHLNLEFQK